MVGVGVGVGLEVGEGVAVGVGAVVGGGVGEGVDVGCETWIFMRFSSVVTVYPPRIISFLVRFSQMPKASLCTPVLSALLGSRVWVSLYPINVAAWTRTCLAAQ